MSYLGMVSGDGKMELTGGGKIPWFSSLLGLLSL